MLDGIYSIIYRGAADWGMAMAIFQQGVITGSDVGGILYDGTYRDLGATVEVKLEMTVPPGATLVQGMPARPTTYKIPIDVMIDKTDLVSSQPVLLQLPPGPVNAIFRRIRSL